MENQESAAGSVLHMTFSKFILRVMAGLGAGIVGTVLVLLIFLATSSFFQPLASADAGATRSPFFLFILVFMVFLGSLGANIIGASLTYFADREKYQKLYSSNIQIVISNVVLLFLMIPVYFLASSGEMSTVAYVAALHFILATQISSLTLEIVSSPNYGLLGAYASAIAIVISLVIAFAVYNFTQTASSQGSNILLFIALPLLWGSLGFAGATVDTLYGLISGGYGVDFASRETSYGKDYGKPEEAAPEEPKLKDLSGSDFLKQK